MNASQPPRDILQTIVDFCDGGGGFAVATVLQARGSTPCKAGAKAVVDAGGAIHGTVGGGMVEAEAQRRCVASIHTGQPEVFEFGLEGGAVRDRAPVCGGAMRVLIDPAAASRREAYAQAAAARIARRRGALLTSIRESGVAEVAVLFLAEEAVTPQTGFPGVEAIRSVLARDEAEWFVLEGPRQGPRLEVLVEPVTARPVLLIVGGGHVGQAVAVQAVLVGFEVVVIDDRPEFADPQRLPQGVAARCGKIGDEVAGFPMDANTYVVIATRSHQLDAEALAGAIHKPAAYLGMIGSRRKVAILRKGLVESGLATEADFDRVQAPMGLDIGAVTVPEIAVATVAQLIAVRRGAKAMRFEA